MPVSLVTGGAGFIGAHVVNELISLEHTVIVLDDLSGGFESNINKNSKFIKGSILDERLLSDLFNEYKFDYVYHLAAYAAEGLSHFIRRFNYKNNLLGSVNLINECVKHNIKCIVFTSSIAVYGEAQLPFSEDTIPVPEDPYGIAKYAVELDLIAAKKLFDLNYIIFRPHNVYGELQNIGDKYRNVIGIFINQLLRSESLSVFGDGLQTRAFTYIDDIAPYIAESVLVPQAYNQIFNIGADNKYSITELAKMIMNVMGVKGELQFFPARKEVTHANADHRKMKNVFKIPEGSFTEISIGIERMVEWAKKEGSRKSSFFNDLEITKDLPSAWIENV